MYDTHGLWWKNEPNNPIFLVRLNSLTRCVRRLQSLWYEIYSMSGLLLSPVRLYSARFQLQLLPHGRSYCMFPRPKPTARHLLADVLIKKKTLHMYSTSVANTVKVFSLNIKEEIVYLVVAIVYFIKATFFVLLFFKTVQVTFSVVVCRYLCVLF